MLVSAPADRVNARALVCQELCCSLLELLGRGGPKGPIRGVPAVPRHYGVSVGGLLSLGSWGHKGMRGRSRSWASSAR